VDRGRVGTVAVARFGRTVGAPSRDSWYADLALSGGVIGDLLVHDLDCARWLCGEVETVYCVPHRAVERHERLLDGAQAVLTHVDGAVSRISATWGPASTDFRYQASVAGTRGAIEYDSAHTPGLTIAVSDAESARGRRAAALSRGNPYLDEIRHFDSVLRGEEKSRVLPEDAVAAVSLVAAATESAETGRVVQPRRTGGHT
jgi:myo-inositol 2-dehydrogenase/D-chiro-inositol 1-dehydrogenase